VDPAGLYGSFNLYIYAEGNPTIYRDPLGLLVQLFCHLVGQGGGLSPHDIAGAIGYKHCFARVKCECEDNNYDKRLEVTGRNRGTGLAEMPENPPDYGEGHGADRIAFLPPDSDSMDCSMEDCILQEYHRRRKEGQPYGSWLSGPNSNTFANDILRACGVQEIFWPAGVPPFTEP
jgi:hypothetical protein